MTEHQHSLPHRIVRRKLFWAAVSLPLAIAGIAGWLTEPLEPAVPAPATEPKVRPVEPPPEAKLAEWPDSAYGGREATVLLLDSLNHARGLLLSAGGYTATFKKTERIKGVLGGEQTIAMKCRNAPFAVYFKYITPEAGKEVAGRRAG